MGLEPTRRCRHKILSLARLPVPTLPHATVSREQWKYYHHGMRKSTHFSIQASLSGQVNGRTRAHRHLDTRDAHPYEQVATCVSKGRIANTGHDRGSAKHVAIVGLYRVVVPRTSWHVGLLYKPVSVGTPIRSRCRGTGECRRSRAANPHRSGCNPSWCRCDSSHRPQGQNIRCRSDRTGWSLLPRSPCT